MTARIGALLARLMFARYLLASIAALGSDFATFLMLDHGGVAPMMAALGGYLVGLIVHWVISTRFVFDLDGGPTHAQRIGFVLSAGVGMGITMALVGALSAVGILPAIAKLLSVPASFLSVYAIRKYGIFSRA
jgi:putative flippase GtrA